MIRQTFDRKKHINRDTASFAVIPYQIVLTVCVSGGFVVRSGHWLDTKPLSSNNQCRHLV